MASEQKVLLFNTIPTTIFYAKSISRRRRRRNYVGGDTLLRSVWFDVSYTVANENPRRRRACVWFDDLGVISVYYIPT